MWIADGWKDYEVIDCSGGEKLERWGDYILLRPDPQVIWDTKKEDKRWRKLNAHYHRSQKGGGEWEFFDLPKELHSALPLHIAYLSPHRLKNFPRWAEKIYVSEKKELHFQKYMLEYKCISQESALS